MKIENLKIKNVRGLTSLEMKPAKLNFITGPSGSGKSSVLDAIRFGLTGKLPKDGLHTGAVSLSVDMSIENIGEISRTQVEGKPMKVRVNEKATTAKSVAEMIEKVYGCSPTTTGIMTSSEILRKKDLAEYLLTEGFLNNDMMLSKLIGLCPGLDVAAQSELYELLPQEPTPVTLEDIDAAYGVVTTSRTAAKKMLAEAQAQAKFEGMPPTRGIQEIQDDIAACNKELGKYEAMLKEYPRQKTALERHKAMLTDLENQLKELDGVTAISAREKQATEELLNKSNELVRQTERLISSLQRDITTIHNILKALDAPVCPISEKLVCTTDKSVVRGELEEQAASKERDLANAKTDLEKFEEDVRKATAAIRDLQERETSYQKKLVVKKQYEDAKTITITVMDEPDPAVAENLRKKVSALNEELLNAQNHERAKEQRARVEVYEKQVRTMELLVKELAPNGGVRKQVLQHSIGLLEEWCNKMMKVILPKYQLFFDADADFELMFKDSAGGVISYDGLSAGEKVRVTVVLLEMLGDLNRFGILLIDDLNALDLDSFKLLVKLLEETCEEYDHVFLAGLDNPGFVEAFEEAKLDKQVLNVR